MRQCFVIIISYWVLHCRCSMAILFRWFIDGFDKEKFLYPLTVIFCFSMSLLSSVYTTFYSAASNCLLKSNSSALFVDKLILRSCHLNIYSLNDRFKLCISIVIAFEYLNVIKRNCLIQLGWLLEKSNHLRTGASHSFKSLIKLFSVKSYFSFMSFTLLLLISFYIFK